MQAVSRDLMLTSTYSYRYCRDGAEMKYERANGIEANSLGILPFSVVSKVQLGFQLSKFRHLT